jgi:SH3 domain-containing YSC84-like protein 1
MEDPNMKNLSTQRHILAASLTLLCGGAASVAVAQTQPAGSATSTNATRNPDEATDAIDTVNKAVQVVHRMEADPSIAPVLKQAKGVYVVPEYGRGALVIGARGGSGVVLVKHGSQWSSPAFFNMGGVSIGAQAGGEGGAVAFLLNNDKAMKSFMQKNKFSLNADAGLTVVDWSKKGTGSAGLGDITAWSNTKGLFGGVAISVTDVNFDEDKNAAYYNRRVAATDVLNGKVKNPQASTLKQALASTSQTGAAAATGTSGMSGSTTSGSGNKGQSGH